MLINLTVRDVGTGIQLSGALVTDPEHPTPAEMIGLYLANNPEAVAKQSWAWFAAQRVAQNLTQENSPS